MFNTDTFHTIMNGDRGVIEHMQELTHEVQRIANALEAQQAAPGPEFIELSRGVRIDASKLVGWQRVPNKVYVYLQEHEGLIFDGDEADEVVSILTRLEAVNG